MLVAGCGRWVWARGSSGAGVQQRVAVRRLVPRRARRRCGGDSAQPGEPRCRAHPRARPRWPPRRRSSMRRRRRGPTSTGPRVPTLGVVIAVGEATHRRVRRLRRAARRRSGRARRGRSRRSRRADVHERHRRRRRGRRCSPTPACSPTSSRRRRTDATLGPSDVVLRRHPAVPHLRAQRGAGLDAAQRGHAGARGALRPAVRARDDPRPKA